jgi:hypothetical protein
MGQQLQLLDVGNFEVISEKFNTQSAPNKFFHRTAAATITICMPETHLLLQTTNTKLLDRVAFHTMTVYKIGTLTYQINCTVVFDYFL